MTTLFTLAMGALGIGLVFLAGYGWLSSGEPTYYVQDLPAFERAYLGPELEAFGSDTVTSSQLNDLWARAAPRMEAQAKASRAEAEATKADAKAQAAWFERERQRQQAEHQAELDRYERAFMKEKPEELQVIMARQIRADAEAQAGIPAYRARIEELEAKFSASEEENAVLAAQNKRYEEALDAYCRTQREQQAALKRLEAENTELWQVNRQFAADNDRLRANAAYVRSIPNFNGTRSVPLAGGEPVVTVIPNSGVY